MSKADQWQEARVTIAPRWPETFPVQPANVFRISRVGHEVELQFGFASMAEIVEGISSRTGRVAPGVLVAGGLSMGPESFLRLYQQMTTIYRAMRESGFLEEED